MEKRAFVVQVSGKKYESFLADYVYFAHNSYPNSAVIILYEGQLCKKTITALNYLKTIGCNIILKQFDFRNYLKMNDTFFKRFIYKKVGVFKCCGRFLIDIPEFHDFDEIYIGDVDLFIIREDNDLFSQHNKHSAFIGLPYSDILRKPINFSITRKKALRCFLKYGKYYFKSIRGKPRNYLVNKMTGLRYIKVEEYYKKVSPYFSNYIDMFDNFFAGDFNSENDEIFSLSSFDDQQIVCSLMKKAFGFLPEISSSDGIDIDNPNSFNYRPHHGIHVKLFCNLRKMNERIVLSKSYKEYYEKYVKAIKNDDFVFVSKYRFGLCKKLIKNLLIFLDKEGYNE